MRFSSRLATGACLLLAGHAVAEPSAGTVDFNRDIRPILSDRCFACHGPDAAARKANLRLDVEADAKLKAVIPGQPDASPLIARISATDPDDVMPPPAAHKPALSAEEIEVFRRWIAEGAPWAQHWAFVKPERPELPPVSNAAWVRTPVDQFVLAKLESQGLSPAPEAPRETLIRRLSFDLTGLPPTPEEVDAFVADNRPDAYERVVERLLNSPHYGERMAMEWLDGARFADTNGYQNDFNRAMWPWRDWVIQAYNNNMPYDQFTVEQLAGDLLPNATLSQQVASGFHRNNRSNTEGGSIEEEWHVEKVVDRIETTGTVFMGLTLGCARCHDHKYDPISQREFYEFFAFFNATEDRGFYEETRGNAGPIVSLPNFEQQLALSAMDAAIAAARTELEAARAGTEDGYAAWKAEVASATPAKLGGSQLLRARLGGDLGIETPAGGGSGVYGGAAPKWAEGLPGPALELDGTPESHVDLGQTVQFSKDQPFSIGMWLRADAPGAPLSKMQDSAAYRGVDMLVLDQGEFAVHLVNEWPANALKVTANEKLPLGKWTHVLVTYDGSSRPQGIKIFFAGRNVGTRTDVATLSGPIDTSEPLRVGRRSDSGFFKGAVADLIITDRALTARKVASIIDGALGPVAAQTDLPEARAAMLREFFTMRGDQRVLEAEQALKRHEEEKAKYQAEKVPTVMVMREMAEPRPTYRLERGQYNLPNKSEQLYPGLPKFLPPMPENAPNNRLGLALWLVSPEHPLTARVAMNREWLRLFGQGLVKTPDNFGTQSEAPTNQPLLDWLATEFIASGWDIKAMLRLLVTSATYRQHSATNPELLARDPENLLLARGPRFRLKAELIRDNALAVSGLLKPRIGGPSVKPYQPEGLWAELAGGAGEGPYVQATGDDLHRRSLYTYRKRTVPHPTMSTFDAPSFEVCTVYRARTNTPLQALALLNDMTYVEAARNLAIRMLTEAAPERVERLTHGFRLATGRRPTPRELELLDSGLTNYLEHYRSAPADADAMAANGSAPAPEGMDRVQLAAYTAVASVVLNLDETITKE